MRKDKGRLGQTRVAWRQAWRGLKRSRLQSILVLVITALPFAFFAYNGVQGLGYSATTQEKVDYQLGNAIAVVQSVQQPNSDWAQWPGEPFLESINPTKQVTDPAPDYVNPIDYFGKNTGIGVGKVARVQWQTKYGVGYLQTMQGELWSDQIGGKVARITSGRAPKASNEVLVSPSALQRLGVSVGDSVQRTNLPTDSNFNSHFTVVGVLEAADYPGVDVVYGTWGAFAATVQNWNLKYYLTTGPEITWDITKRANQQGIVVISRDVLLNPPATEDIPLAVANQPVGGSPYDPNWVSLVNSAAGLLYYAITLLLPVSVLTGAAFSYGMRRQTHSLALLASQGANKRTLLAVTVFAALILSVTGAVVGTLLGWGLAAVLLPMVSQGDWRAYSGFHLPWVNTGLLLLASVVLAVIVSIVPARQTLSLNVLGVMRGNNIPQRLRVRTGIAGLILLGLGTAFPAALTVYDLSSNTDALQGALIGLGLLLSVLALILGLIVGSGWILRGISALLTALGKWFNWLTAKFAGRDLLLSRRRFGPLVAALVTIGFVLTGLIVPTYSSASQSWRNYQRTVPENQVLVDGQMAVTDYQSSTGPNGSSTSYTLERATVTPEELEQLRTQITNSSDIFESSRVYSVHSNPLAYFDASVRDSTEARTLVPIVLLPASQLCSYVQTDTGSATLPLQDRATQHCDYDLLAGAEFLVGGVDELRALLNGRVDEVAETTLAAGGVVTFNQAYTQKAKANASSPSGLTETIDWLPMIDVVDASMGAGTKVSPDNLIPERSIEVPIAYTEVTKGDQYQFRLMISPATADALRIDYSQRLIMFRVSEQPSQQLTDWWMARGVELRHDNYLGTDPNLILLYAWLISLGLVLTAAGISVGLTQLEGRNDQRTFARLGASRWFVGRVSALQVFATVLVSLMLGSLAAQLLVAVFAQDHVVPDNPWGWVLLLCVVSAALTALITLVATPRNPERKSRVAIE